MYYYVYNLQGDVTHIIDANKNIVGTYQYDAWGKILNLNSLTSIAQINPFRYRGYYYDNESGLYYLNSRYYNSEWGRFINADGYVSTGQGIMGYNMFTYCGNNPIVYVDKTGQFPWLAVIIIGGCAVIGGILGAKSNKSLTNNANATIQNSNQNIQKPSINESQNNKSIVQIENNFLRNSNSASTSMSTQNVIPPSVSVPELTISDRIKNTIIGATLGAATGGAIVALGGMGFSLAFGANAMIGGATGAQTFAIGALAFNSFAMVVGPFFGIELEPIEWE